jgi:DNA-binding MarR family transcriptional regulator
LRGLGDEGLVTITEDEIDRRQVLVGLDDRGREMMRLVARVLRRLERRFTHEIGAEAMASLQVALHRDWPQ